ncbi:7-carboxy-7-deazaguanine synthase [Caldanaerobius fijiensis DSM 17918]|uniref:7-carboxy-7-deazaguanine synthase n=1 Tax=Caldanaerobius fijiensis DSM 17918 TaxID=1121256 RepID=A0A1M4ZPE4_9THEO|nr:radical SAM protein [Caldanaerobius fijiensis]SHF19672.1 7-carboxy-7-deazaguanine synthase [Caldanaerobius fijiensis DSM 17918]
MLKVNEIFTSIQGESTSTGYLTVFVRLTGCNLRCSYCDTRYAYDEGQLMTVGQVYSDIARRGIKRVCITGGEPLLQPDVQRLIDMLEDYEVSIETNGSVDLSQFKLYDRHRFVMDMKVPSSGSSNSMNYENFNYLRSHDEIKFVIGNKSDYYWAKDVIKKYYKRGIITFSPVYGVIEPVEIVNWMIEDKLDNVRFQLQLHKYIWDPGIRGV